MLTGIATAAAISSAEYRAAFFLASGTIATGLVVALGIKHGYVQYSRFDISCQIAAVTGIILWQMFNDPLLAIFSSIIVDAVAGLPTLRHSWLKPFEETWQTFAIGCFAAVVGLLGIRDYNLTNASFAIYLIMANMALFTTILYRRQFVKA
jgi:energy-converting hydrogenase Eha subunit A